MTQPGPLGLPVTTSFNGLSDVHTKVRGIFPINNDLRRERCLATGRNILSATGETIARLLYVYLFCNEEQRKEEFRSSIDSISRPLSSLSTNSDEQTQVH